MYAFFNSSGNEDLVRQLLQSVSQDLDLPHKELAITYCGPNSVNKSDISRLKPEELASYIWTTRYSDESILVKLPVDLSSDQLLIEKYQSSYLGCLPKKAKRISLRNIAAQCKKIKSLEKYRKHFSLSLFVNKSTVKVDPLAAQEIDGIFSLQAKTNKPAYRLIEERIHQLREELFMAHNPFVRNF